MYGRNNLRFGQAQQIIAAPQFQGMIPKPFAPEIRLCGLKTLNHGPQGPDKDKYPPRSHVRKLFSNSNHSIIIAKEGPLGQGVVSLSIVFY
jgi:hypothetical protein